VVTTQSRVWTKFLAQSIKQGMKRFFTPNIGFKGRVFRGLSAVAFFVAAWFAFRVSIWLSMLLVVCGVFGVFEALRGWCALRACGIKTKL